MTWVDYGSMTLNARTELMEEPVYRSGKKWSWPWLKCRRTWRRSKHASELRKNLKNGDMDQSSLSARYRISNCISSLLLLTCGLKKMVRLNGR